MLFFQCVIKAILFTLNQKIYKFCEDVNQRYKTISNEFKLMSEMLSSGISSHFSFPSFYTRHNSHIPSAWKLHFHSPYVR